MFSLVAPPGQTEALDFETSIVVTQGDRVDFVLDAIDGTDYADSTLYEVQLCQ